MKKYAFCILALAAFGGSCTSSNKHYTGSDSTVVADTLAYTYKTLIKESKHYLVTDSTRDTTRITIRYPEFTNETLKAYVIGLLVDADSVPNTRTAESIAHEFVADYDKFTKENTGYGAPWFQRMNIGVAKQYQGLIPLTYSIENYTGGAHGNYGTFFHNYDTGLKRELKLSDLVDNANMASFLATAEKIFRKEENYPASKPLSEGYWFADDKFSLNDNFLITPEGLKFQYNPYEIKSYAEGITILLLPYSEIGAFIKPNTVVSQFIDK